MSAFEVDPEPVPLPPDLLDLLLDPSVSDAALGEVIADLPPSLVASVLAALPPRTSGGSEVPASPVAQAVEIDSFYRVRSHLAHVSDRIAAAMDDVERGVNRRLIIEMPPRLGKTTLATLFTPLWVLRRHPDWPIALTSHDGNLATSWGRQVRRWVVSLPHLGVDVASDAGAAGEWETTAGGKVLAVSVRESFTGRGAKVLVIDDPHKDFIDAHSALSRQTIWDWWLSVAQLRLEPPYLVIVVMTRWHEDDLVGRLLSPEHEGDPSGWEVIRLPAVADHETGLDAIGREPGEPLLSPLIEEDVHAASARWAEVRSSVGSYVWASLMQQRPAPSKGAIFDTSWWRFWTRDPAKATPDGRVILLDPYTDPMVSRGGRWIESWDCAFKGTDDSDFVVGQRWVRHGTRRILVAQRRDRLTFTATLAAMNDWADDPLASLLVYERLVEDKANGTAIIDTLQASVDGLIPINPTTSKEARARSVTPEVESGNVYLPHPLDPGNEWVGDYLTEMRDFPHGSHDDQVDATSQALTRLRDVGTGALVVPGSVARPPTSPPRRRAQVAAAGGIRRGYR